MDRRHIDPAALLIAVLTVAATPIAMAGPWDLLDSLVAVVVLVIVTSFTLIGKRRQELQGSPEKVAVWLVLVLIFAVAAAYPVQEWIVKHWWHSPGNKISSQRADVLADYATYISLGLGVLAVLGLARWVSRKSRAHGSDAPQSNDNAQLKELKEENERLRSECDQLKQSVAYWVREATAQGENLPEGAKSRSR